MKKIVCCLIILLFSSGCTATYNLSLNNNGFKEEVSFYESDSRIFDKDILRGNTYRSIVQNLYNNPKGVLYNDQNNDSETGIIEGRKYYNSKLIDDGRLGLIYSYNFSKNNYLDSYVLNLCFDSKDIYKEGNVTVLTTNKGFNCYNFYPYLENVVVNVITDYKVTMSNADSVNGNTYTWNITKDNASSKIIFIKYKIALEDNHNENKTSNFWKTNWKIILMIFIGLSLVGLFVFNSIMQKNKMNNRL